jgi:2'-5' RNA ligase
MKLSIVSYLDKDTTEIVRKWQHELSAITGSVAAVVSWEPHVTIGDGVEVSEPEIPGLLANLRKVTALNSSFPLRLSGIGTFDSRPIGRGETSTPYVIYLVVTQNDALLHLVRDIAEATNGYQKWYRMHVPYTPHVTLAFRDLDKPGYEKGLAYLSGKSFDVTTEVHHIALVEKLENNDLEYTRLSLAKD